MLSACAVGVASGTGTDAVIRLLARAQYGRVARWQMLDGGVSDPAIQRRVRRGWLVREFPGVYVLAGAEALPLGPDAAAVLAGGLGACLSHHSAAVLWQLRRGRADPVHVTVPYGRGCRPEQPRLVVHRSRILTPADIRIHDGLPVTSPARTLLDVAARLPDREVEQMLDEALFVRRILTRPQLDATLRRSGRHQGRVRLARVAGASRAGTRRTDSRPEAELLQLILAAGLPPPRTQTTVLDYRLDLYWPEHGLAVEVDTYGTHGSPRRFAADRRRDARLLSERGIVVLRFTDVQIRERPLEIVVTLTRGLARSVE